MRFSARNAFMYGTRALTISDPSVIVLSFQDEIRRGGGAHLDRRLDWWRSGVSGAGETIQQLPEEIE